MAAAHLLLQSPEKHRLVVVSRDQSSLERLRSQYPEQVAVLPGDLNNFSLASDAVDLALSRFGGELDGLIINQGTLRPVSRIAEVDIDEVRHAFDVNFFSAVACVREVLWYYELLLIACRSRPLFRPFGNLRDASSWSLLEQPLEALSGGEHTDHRRQL